MDKGTQYKERIAKAAEFLKETMPFESAEYGLVLGSGLGGIYEACEGAEIVPYSDVPYMRESTAPLHEGRFVLGNISGKNVICMQGRLHAYEGNSAQDIAFPIYVMGNLGVTTLCVTNAAGGINKEYGVGDLMLISDHINFQGINPCAGLDTPELAPRFFDMTNAYAPRLREELRSAARRVEVETREGVYIGVLGPSFETPAEIRAFRTMGADAVGMSTVSEVIAANSLGMEVLGISMISNPAAGVLPDPLDMDDVQKAAALAASNLERVLVEWLKR